MYIRFPEKSGVPTLADYSQALTRAESVLGADRPVWEVLIVAGGGILLLTAAYKAIQKETRKAKKAVGL